MKLDLSADEVLTTTRSVRKRLDFDRPVERAVVEECLEIAFQAPTGSNLQTWAWVVVEDQARRTALAEVYRMRAHPIHASWKPPPLRGLAWQPAREHRVGGLPGRQLPSGAALLIPCIDGRLDGLSVPDAAGRWGSILPAVWSFMLAGRERGLGSAWVTAHLGDGGERAVAEIVGIPCDTVSQVGMFPVAYTIGTDFK